MVLNILSEKTSFKIPPNCLSFRGRQNWSNSNGQTPVREIKAVLPAPATTVAKCLHYSACVYVFLLLL